MLRHVMAFLALVLLTAAPMGVAAQDADAPAQIDRSATGGAQTLDDILRRQEGLKVDDDFRRNSLERAAERAEAAGTPPGGLGPRGAASDADLWRALRYDEADVRSSTLNPNGRVLIQDGGMWWLEFREGPLAHYGGLLLLVTIAVLAVFYLLRGRVRIEGGKAGTTVLRFQWIERFAHWMLAGSFILLGLTGLFTLFGRMYLIPILGHEANSVLLTASKFIHNNVSWAFMLALVMVFFMWVWHNIPNRTDLTWFAQAGGIIGKNHPPAKKFNAGQKIIFWSVILLGASISVSGLSLLFPFDMPLFAHSFQWLNDLGAPGWVGMDPLPVDLAPQEEMQFAQLWHSIVAFGLMAVIIGHIYIGTVGMEGAYDAMGSGEVDENWAHQHHSIWYDELKARGETPKGKSATPAE